MQSWFAIFGVAMHLRKHHPGGMFTLHIEHGVRDFETWQAAFARDPIGRAQAGVRHHRVSRPTDDTRYVVIDLDFDDADAARAFLDRLQEVWRRPDLSPGLARTADAAAAPPRTRISELVDQTGY
jgi:hypothetical protein